MGVDSWSVTARPWKLPSLNFCQHWNSINQISKLFEHFFQSSVMIVDDRTKGGFSALIWKELGNNGHHPELHSRKLCQKDSWKSSWNSLKGRNIFKFPIKNYAFCIFLLPRRDFQTNTAPGSPATSVGSFLWKSSTFQSPVGVVGLGSTKGGTLDREIPLENPAIQQKNSGDSWSWDRFSFLKAEIETIHYNYKNPTIQQVLNSNKNNQWWRLWTCLIGWQANSTSKKKQYKISFVSGSESSKKKKQLFQKGNLPNQPPWNGWFLRVSNGFNPPWTFSLPLCAPKIRVGSWCPLASGLGQKRGQDALKIPWRLPKRDPLPGWWFQPIWKKLVKMGIFPK